MTTWGDPGDGFVVSFRLEISEGIETRVEPFFDAADNRLVIRVQTRDVNDSSASRRNVFYPTSVRVVQSDDGAITVFDVSEVND